MTATTQSPTYRIKKVSMFGAHPEWIIFAYGDNSQTPLGTHPTRAATAAAAREQGFQLVSQYGIKIFWSNSLQGFVTIPED